jgi:hypothetical protein
MATNHNKEILHLKQGSKKHKDNIQRVTSKISSTNSKLQTFEANATHKFAAVKGELAPLTTSLNQWLK